ncbi:Uncharacterised protein [uncultured archaeon]|nr:Uncharacterised protein [uncultured archaeon]
MIILTNATTDSLKVITASGVVNIDMSASYVDYNGSTVTPANAVAQVATATTTTLVGTPGASTQRNVKHVHIRNSHATSSNLVTVELTINAVTVTLIAYTLLAGEALMYYEDDGWVVMDASGGLKTAAAAGRFLKVTVLTSGTSFTTGAGTNTIKTRLLAGGGAGGGAASATSSGAAGGGGGAGGYAEKTFAVTPNTAYTYAIGAAGLAGATGNNPGGAGGNTTFAVGATTVTANGGNGGTGMAANAVAGTTALGGAPATVSTNGDVNGSGAPGEQGYLQTAALLASGAGGSSQFGAGGNVRTSQGTGNSAVGFGAGGAGGACVSAGGAVAGGGGTAGIIIVEEYS